MICDLGFQISELRFFDWYSRFPAFRLNYFIRMSIVVDLIIVLIFALDVYWWRQAHLRLARVGHARGWRVLLAVFMGCLILLLTSRLLPPGWSRRINDRIPLAFIAGQYLWHLSILPISIVLALTFRAMVRAVKLLRPRRVVSASADGTPAAAISSPIPTRSPVRNPQAYSLSRRQLLSAAAVSIPPSILAGMTGVSLTQLGGYRVRSFDVKIPNLPANLDGLLIAHLSDFHAGQFMTPRNMAPIIDSVNDMRPDLVLITGDLIDYALYDLPPALDALRRLKPKYGREDGIAMCVGNHDCIENRFTFRRVCADAGFPLLANDARTIQLKGASLQFLAVDWCKTDEMTSDALWRTSHLRDPAAFPIMLAHHPHAFDQAAMLDFPLTLSGHTHGGQIMLNESVGVGAIKFRYRSGLYRKPNGSQLIVSNGIGNWFPLRVNAPAEVLRLTLRRAT